MTRHPAELIAAVALLATGVTLITAPLRQRYSRRAFVRARAIALAEPTPVAADSEPNPRRAGRGGRRGRGVVRALLDGSAWAEVDAAAAAAACVSGGVTWPYAMLVSPRDVTVLLAGLLPAQLPAPWQRADRGWTIDRRHLAAAAPQGPLCPSDTFVTLGSCNGRAVLLDLASAPAVIAVTGDPRAARALLLWLVMQLGTAPRNQVLVTPGFLPGAPEARPARLLDRLGPWTAMSDQASMSWIFIVCASTDPAELDELRLRAEESDRLRILVLGTATGSRWSLLVSADGTVTAAGLDLVASSRPVVDLLPSPRPAMGRILAGDASLAQLGSAGSAPPAFDQEESCPVEEDEEESWPVEEKDEEKSWPPELHDRQEENRPSDDAGSDVTLPIPAVRVRGPHTDLLASDRAFLADELEATVARHPALGLASAREPGAATTPSAEHLPALSSASGERAGQDDVGIYDPVLGAHPALGPVPDRDPCLAPSQAPEDH